MSDEALLATPARPLYELSHRSQKKSRPKSLPFCADNTVTDDQQMAPVHSEPPFFGFRAYSRGDRLPTPPDHKVRRIAADIRTGSRTVLTDAETRLPVFPDQRTL
jgi:hypothetical protein